MAASSVSSSLASLSSNFDVNTLVSQLMSAEQKPLSLLSQKRSAANAEISAWGKLKSALGALQTGMRAVNGLEDFNPVTASVADATVGTATATSAATAGSYALEVSALAQRHTLATAALPSSSSPLGTGTLTIQFGTYSSGSNTFATNAARSTLTVAIGAGQDTLAGVRDAINAAGGDVSASIVTDANGARLVLASDNAGAADSMRITVADDDGTAADASGLSRLAYDPTAAVGAGRNLTQAAAAQDASFKLNGLSLTSASNTVTGALEGVSLTLSRTNAGAPTTVNVVRDATAATASVQKFVTAWNDATNTLRNLTAYDPSGRSTGQLQGDNAATGVLAQLRAVLGKSLTALTGSTTTLAQVGVSFQRDGTLALDQAKLRAAVNAAGGDIGALFAPSGKGSASTLSYVGKTTATTPGTYAVSVSQVATRGTLDGSDPAGLVIDAGVNDTLTIDVDGTSATVTLGAGTYASADALAAEVQTRLNGAAALSGAGISVAVTASGGVLSVASNRWGSTSSVASASGNAADTLFGSTPAETAGQDVAGTIGGVAATGKGRILTGGSGNGAEGLRIDVAATATGAAGTMSFSRGYADQLATALDAILGAKGSIQGRVDSLNAQVKKIDDRTAAEQDRLAATEKRYRTQFTALASMLSRMSSTSSFLTSQLANLPGSTNNSN